jgi:N-acetylneuraminic acid mutarotase
MSGGESAKGDFIWTQKADMPTPREGQTSAVVNGKIYAIAGWTSEPNARGLATVEEYDPATNTWTRKADMPTGRCVMVGSSPVVDGKIYVFGVGDTYEVEEYDPSTDTWTRKADMLVGSSSMGSVVLRQDSCNWRMAYQYYVSICHCASI